MSIKAYIEAVGESQVIVDKMPVKGCIKGQLRPTGTMHPITPCYVVFSVESHFGPVFSLVGVSKYSFSTPPAFNEILE